MPPTSATRRPWRIAALLLSILLGTLALSIPAAAASPVVGDFFEYDFNTYVDQGAGDYVGYSDSMHSHSRYTVQSLGTDPVKGATATFRGTGSWTFEDSYGARDSGAVDETPTIVLATREYLSGLDVDGTFTDPRAWFWIPTPIAAGQAVQILDDVFTVTSLDATVWLGGVPHKAALLVAGGTWTRNDAYGSFDTRYTDRYYFDTQTGYVISEQYEEFDTNPTASFRYRAELVVTASSFAIPLDIVSLALVYGGIPAVVAVAILGAVRARLGPSRIRVGPKEDRTIVRIFKAKTPADVVGLEPDGSPFFGPFLPVFAERSVAEGDPVVLALADRRIVGMALVDGESGLGSLFASEPEVARVLLKRLRMQAFFADATIPSWTVKARELDRFTILQLRNPQPLAYDPQTVRPLTSDDLNVVAGLTEDVYGGRARRFIESSFRGGDLGFVAVSNGRVVGFGFATVVGTVARLHTLTVAAQERARGLGTEIMNARLSALAALGVDRVIVEISKQNAASMRIATRAGFASIGETVYYSRQPEMAPAALQRRT